MKTKCESNYAFPLTYQNLGLKPLYASAFWPHSAKLALFKNSHNQLILEKNQFFKKIYFLRKLNLYAKLHPFLWMFWEKKKTRVSHGYFCNDWRINCRGEWSFFSYQSLIFCCLLHVLCNMCPCGLSHLLCALHMTLLSTVQSSIK